MIYIISGASRSGKSIVARRFFKKRLIPYIPLDSIMMGFMNGIPSMKIHDKLWPNEIAEKIWPFLEAMCENMINNKIDYVFEGEAVLPELIKKLSDRYPGQIKICFMGFADTNVEKKVLEVKKYKNDNNDWLVTQTDEYIKSHIENMKTYSLRIKDECMKWGLDYFEISIDFEKTVEKVLRFLDKN